MRACLAAVGGSLPRLVEVVDQDCDPLSIVKSCAGDFPKFGYRLRVQSFTEPGLRILYGIRKRVHALGKFVDQPFQANGEVRLVTSGIPFEVCAESIHGAA